MNRRTLIGAVAAGAALPLLNRIASAQTSPKTKNVVFVHGLFADGSCWSKVIARLQQKGVNCTSVQNPLTSLHEASEAARRAIAAQPGPTVLVGHSFSGMIVSDVGVDAKVTALVYVAARAPDARGSGAPSEVSQRNIPVPGRPGGQVRTLVMARLVTVGVRLVGLLTVLSVIAPLLHRRLRPELWYGLPQSASVAALVITVLAGAGLVMLAAGLRRGKRRAWQLSLAACVVLLVVHGVGRHPVPAGVVALMLAGLLGARREFTAGPDPVGRLAAARVVVQLLLGGFLVELLMLFVRPSLLAGHPSGWQRVEHAALALVGVSGPVTFRVDWVDDLTAAVGLSFGVAAVLVGGYFLLRSGEPRPSMTKDEESAVRRLLVEHGRSDSLGYFALRGDKSVVFSASGKAAVSYRVLAAVALASGDPLGNVEAWPGAISEFLTQCRRFGWVPAVLGCSESGAKVWTRHGRLDALELGDEAVIDVAGFSLQGRAMRSVRQAVSRVRRAGYQTQVRRVVDIPVGELAALRALVERWRGTPAERGFSMALSRFGEPELDPDALVVTATTLRVRRGSAWRRRPRDRAGGRLRRPDRPRGHRRGGHRRRSMAGK